MTCFNNQQKRNPEFTENIVPKIMRIRRDRCTISKRCQSVVLVEKVNLNCGAPVNFLLLFQEDQQNWGGKILIHAVGSTFSWLIWEYWFSISVKYFSQLSQWKIPSSNWVRFCERGVGCNSLTSDRTLKTTQFWMKQRHFRIKLVNSPYCYNTVANVCVTPAWF